MAKDKGENASTTSSLAGQVKDPTVNSARANSRKAPISQLEAKQKQMMAKMVAASFGELVTLMMRTPRFRKMPLESLEAMAAAPVALGQVAIAEAQNKETGAVMPIAAVTWAMVSPEIDRRLSDVDGEPATLSPKEWRSGDVPWIVDAIGERRAVGRLLHQLIDTVFKDKHPKMRTMGADGKPSVGRIERVERQDDPADDAKEGPADKSA